MTDNKRKDEIIAAQHTEERDYWLERLSGELVKSCFPYDFSGGEGAEAEKKDYDFDFPVDLSERLLFMSNKSDARLHMLLTGGLTALLGAYSGNDDVLMGTPMVRQDVEAKFINTILILRNRLSEGMTFKELLMQVRQTLSEAAKNINYPIDTLLYKLNLPTSDMTRDFPLFEVGLMLTNIHDIDYFSQVNLKVIFSFTREAEGVRGRIHYDPAFYKKESARRFSTHFLQLLRQLVFNVDGRVLDAGMLSEAERDQLLFQFNHIGKEEGETVSTDKRLHGLFWEQVEKTPDNPAVTAPDLRTGTEADGEEGESVTLTYAQLGDRVNGLVQHLRDKGAQPGQIVALMVEPSIQMAVAVLGVLSAGCAYLPIDPAYPGERIKYMLEDSSTEMLLTSHSAAKNAGNARIKTMLFLEDIAAEKNLSGTSGARVSVDLSPDDPAYVIYTSGTTGRPKGVVVEHGNVVNTLLFRKEAYEMGPEDTALQLFSYAFDGFVTSFFTPLISGAPVVMVSDKTLKDVALVTETVMRRQVTHMICVPPFFQAIIEFMAEREARSLKVVTLAGDKISPSLLEEVRRKNPSLQIVNEYGVTEGAVMSTLYRGQEKDDEIKIGQPIAGTQLAILNGRGRLLPVGVPGELYISGAGVARGYLNNPQLTAEKFVAPGTAFDAVPWASRFYRTGDLAAWLPDGNIRFFGRIDHQVKIRGYRIEIGEIESCIRSHKKIKDTVILAVEGRGAETGGEGDSVDVVQDTFLCAYVAPTDMEAFANPAEMALEIKEHISALLPSFMIPSCFIPMETIPLTSTGKVDRKALPDPGVHLAGDQYVAPENDVQAQLAAIWQEVLGVQRLGITDNFFRVGGDSIKAMQISARLKKYRLDLKIDDLFLNPTIKELAGQVTETSRFSLQETVTGDVPLTPIQQWFFDDDLPGKEDCRFHFNQSVMLYREKGFDADLLEKVFAHLVEHHDALRMVYGGLNRDGRDGGWEVLS